MGESVLWLISLVLLVYTIIPTVLMRVFEIGAFHNSEKPGVALTFDDGPDPKYTPMLLDLLQEHGVKATFFVLGAKAERSPELIQRMHREGHLIGLHNYVHWTNGLMAPWRVRRQLDRSVEIILRITGETPLYYRPPWGVVNIFDFMLSKRFQIVLWSFLVGDWLKRTGKNKIKRRLIKQWSSGAVIVLHDSGDTLGADADAPEQMLEALDEFLTEFADAGCHFVRIDEKIPKQNAKAPLSAGKRVLVWLWLQWEKVFQRLYRVHPIAPGNELLSIKARRYHGARLMLGGGEALMPGDRVLELHFNNKTLFELSRQSRSTVQLAVQLIRAMEQCLPHLAEQLIEDPELHDVKGLYGISMIHRGASKFGFTVENLPKGWFLTLTNIYLKCLLYVIHPEGKQRLGSRTELLTPKVIGISATELKRRYARHEAGTDPGNEGALQHSI